MEKLDLRSPVPLYRQLADRLRDRIAAGEFSPDEPLPSESRLMQEYGVSRVTVRKAYQVLRESGVVVTLPQRGSFIRLPGE